MGIIISYNFFDTCGTFCRAELYIRGIKIYKEQLLLEFFNCVSLKLCNFSVEVLSEEVTFLFSVSSALLRYRIFIAISTRHVFRKSPGSPQIANHVMCQGLNHPNLQSKDEDGKALPVVEGGDGGRTRIQYENAIEYEIAGLSKFMTIYTYCISDAVGVRHARSVQGRSTNCHILITPCMQ